MPRLISALLSYAAVFFLKPEAAAFMNDLRRRYHRYSRHLKSKMPKTLDAALIAAEDHRFFSHSGFDPKAFSRALWRFSIGKSVEGGSTIEQQLARVMTKRYERTIRRKIREILLASLVERVVPKSDIPGLYLSVAYFGWKMNGVAAACDRLQFSLDHLTVQQAATIVARLKYPEPRNASPARRYLIDRRTRHILKLLTRSPGDRAE